LSKSPFLFIIPNLKGSQLKSLSIVFFIIGAFWLSFIFPIFPNFKGSFFGLFFYSCAFICFLFKALFQPCFSTTLRIFPLFYFPKLQRLFVLASFLYSGFSPNFC